MRHGTRIALLVLAACDGGALTILPDHSETDVEQDGGTICVVGPPDASAPFVFLDTNYGIAWHPAHGAHAWGGANTCPYAQPDDDICLSKPSPASGPMPWDLPGRPLVAAGRGPDAVGGPGGYCVLTDEGTLACWEPISGTTPNIDGVRHFSKSCLLGPDGRVRCGEEDVGLAGGVRLVDTKWYRDRPACVLDAAGHVTCEDGPPPAPFDGPDRCWTVAARTTSSVGKVETRLACGIDGDRHLVCHGRASLEGELVPLPWGEEAEAWRDVTVDSESACAITSEGVAYCWQLELALGAFGPDKRLDLDASDFPFLRPPSGHRFVAIDVGGANLTEEVACAFTEAGELVCWGEPFLGSWLISDVPDLSAP